MPDSAFDVIPYVSIVLAGRNDNYDGDFLKRFFTALQFNHRELEVRAIAHEFVLVEWAPIPGVPYLIDLLEERCSASLVETVRAVIVDPAYQQAMTLSPRIVFHQYLAKNVGVRRSRGEYLISTNCDVILGRRILQRLEERALEPEVLYRAPRWDLAPTVEVERIDWACLEATANLARPGKQLRPPYFRGSTGDFILLDRDTFQRLGGFNEIYRLSRSGVDANLVTHAVSSGIRVVDIGGPVYHLHHDRTTQVLKARPAGSDALELYGNKSWRYRDVVYRNRQTWGSAQAPERTIGPRRTYLDFSWDAVPPLVDLAGIVVPSTRASGNPLKQRR